MKTLFEIYSEFMAGFGRFFEDLFGGAAAVMEETLAAEGSGGGYSNEGGATEVVGPDVSVIASPPGGDPSIFYSEWN